MATLRRSERVCMTSIVPGDPGSPSRTVRDVTYRAPPIENGGRGVLGDSGREPSAITCQDGEASMSYGSFYDDEDTAEQSWGDQADRPRRRRAGMMFLVGG